MARAAFAQSSPKEAFPRLDRLQHDICLLPSRVNRKIFDHKIEPVRLGSRGTQQDIKTGGQRMRPLRVSSWRGGLLFRSRRAAWRKGLAASRNPLLNGICTAPAFGSWGCVLQVNGCHRARKGSGESLDGARAAWVVSQENARASHPLMPELGYRYIAECCFISTTAFRPR
jgi:hypothetical protein